jgi:hypothetical protein
MPAIRKGKQRDLTTNEGDEEAAKVMEKVLKDLDNTALSREGQ